MHTRSAAGVVARPDARRLPKPQIDVVAAAPKIRLVPRVYCSRALPESWSAIARTVIGGALT